MAQQTDTRLKIGEYELLDHGIEGSQYFPGCGVSFTRFAHVVTGCGETFGDALEDALEQIGEHGYDADTLESTIRKDEGYEGKEWPTEPSASSVFRKYNPDAQGEDGEWDYDACELYYYVSIRWNSESADGEVKS